MNTASHRWRCRYVYTEHFNNPRHSFEVVGAKGGMHLHITDLGEKWAEVHSDRYSAGLETHYRSPPEYMAEDAPSQDECWLLHAPCWHDGTSLYAQEHWVPIFAHGATPADMLARLRHEADERFYPVEEAAQ